MAAEREQVVALGINDDNQLQVGLYAIVSDAAATLELRLDRSPAALGVSYEIVGPQPSDPWLWYSRVATCGVGVCDAYLAAAVRLEQVVVEQEGGLAGRTRDIFTSPDNGNPASSAGRRGDAGGALERKGS